MTSKIPLHTEFVPAGLGRVLRSLARAVCGRQRVREGLEWKDRWPGKGFIPKGGRYHSSLGGGHSSKSNNAGFFATE